VRERGRSIWLTGWRHATPPWLTWTVVFASAWAHDCHFHTAHLYTVPVTLSLFTLSLFTLSLFTLSLLHGPCLHCSCYTVPVYTVPVNTVPVARSLFGRYAEEDPTEEPFLAPEPGKEGEPPVRGPTKQQISITKLEGLLGQLQIVLVGAHCRHGRAELGGGGGGGGGRKGGFCLRAFSCPAPCFVSL
jgi:hypothetical protein